MSHRGAISVSESNRQQTKTVYNLLVKCIDDAAKLPLNSQSGDEIARFATERTEILQMATRSPTTQKAMTSMVHALNNLIEPGNIQRMIEQNPECSWWGLFLFDRAFDDYWNSSEMTSRGLSLRREMRLFPHAEAMVKFSIVVRGNRRNQESAPALRVVDFTAASATGSSKTEKPPRKRRAKHGREDVGFGAEARQSETYSPEPRVKRAELAKLSESLKSVSLFAEDQQKGEDQQTGTTTEVPSARRLSWADESELDESQIVYEDESETSEVA